MVFKVFTANKESGYLMSFCLEDFFRSHALNITCWIWHHAGALHGVCVRTMRIIFYHPGGGTILSNHLPRVVFALLFLVTLLLHALHSEVCRRWTFVCIAFEGTLVLVIIPAVLCFSFWWFALRFVSGQIGFLILWKKDAFIRLGTDG